MEPNKDVFIGYIKQKSKNAAILRGVFKFSLKMLRRCLYSFCTVISLSVCGQDKPVVHILDSVLIRNTIQPHLAEVQGVYIFSGKKTNDIVPDASGANLASNLARMVFARIPGVNVWEMDGAGTQVNIGGRGTDTHRSIEMNMRQNGYNTNSDMFGYPEDHYTPPMQAIREIQLVRGSAALQFGSQFGGMMNYLIKNGDSARPFVLESEQTVGANKFFNSFNAAGGTAGKVNYYAYFDQRQGDGWRPNAGFVYQSFYAAACYNFNRKGNIAFQFSRMNYRQQIAGGLTDAQFAHDARQSFRSRNFFSPEINIPAFVFNYTLSPGTQLSITSHYLGGQRNSVQFINTPNVMDTINTTLGTYNPRQVDRDYYSGFTTEARLLHRYALGKVSSVLTGGVRYFTESTRRRQKGIGTTGSDFDLSLVKSYGVDLKLHTDNYAAFVENLFRISSRWSVTPGIRYELIRSKLNGVISNASFPVTYTGNRNFALFGMGAQYQATKGTQFYGNISQAYRPYLYASITPADQVGVIDPNLKDSKGYDMDLGYRGRVGDWMHFDVNLFYVFYGDRAGQLTLTKPDGSSYLYTTNIGNAVAKGAEAYAEISLAAAGWDLGKGFDIHIFNSLSYTHARYVSGQINNNGHNLSLKGNWIEGTPEWIDRAGFIFQSGALRSTLQYSYVGKAFSDVNNTVFNPLGATGTVPAYHIWDWSADWAFLTHYHVSAGINNLADSRYFTRRISMYPGPGILPADGRTFYVSLGLKL
jgi:Fe(3+) dicitrate transport protein